MMRSMETAPRDGTRILVKTSVSHYFGNPHFEYRPVGTAWVECRFFEDALQLWCGNARTKSTEKIEPLGWAPLPDDEPVEVITGKMMSPEELSDRFNQLKGAMKKSPPQLISVEFGQSINLTSAEIQSGYDRVQWAADLIRQLPEDHDGRNSWLLNYGKPE